MIPITRKEHYLNRIVGNKDYPIPEKPITTEEFFFAEILGEAVQAPEPLTRYQMYLAKIAGKNIEIPYPRTRLEYFLARAAGMDVETPVPITREEIYWSNYTAIVEFELEGVPPLTYKAIEGTLTDYRIYGQTSRNLFDMKKFAELCYPRYASVTFADNTLSFTSTATDAYVNYVYDKGNTVSDIYRPSCIDVLPSTTYTISTSSMPKCYISWIDSSYKAVSTYTRIPVKQSYYTFTTPSNCTKLLIRLGKEVTNIGDTFTISNIMLNTGSTPLPYEPYGDSVGDRTGNLFDGEFLQGYWALADGAFMVSSKWISTQKIPCKANTDYTFTFGIKSRWYAIVWYDIDGNYIKTTDSRTESQPTIFTAMSPANAAFMGIDIAGLHGSAGQVYDIRPTDVTDFMLVEGSTPHPYEPYGYKVPVTVSNGTDTLTTPIYLPEPLKMVGDEAEYIDFEEQKQHRVRKNLINSSIYEIRNTGVEYTVNNDKSITANGSTSSTFSLFLVKVYLTKGSYIISGCPQNGSINTYRCEIRDMKLSSLAQDTGAGAMYRIVTDGYYYYSIRIAQNYVCNNLTFYPMIRKADIEDDTYEPYIKNTELDVTLPALPTLSGTNTLLVGTEVQPSKVYIQAEKEREYS